MPNCLILYHSVTNTTARVAESIAEGLREAGYQTRLCNINKEACPDISNYDLIGFGTPVYFFQIPLNITDCIDNLPGLNNKRSFAFLLNGSYAWNAADFLKRSLKKRGAEIIGWFSAYGADYFIAYNRLGVLASPNHPTEEELNRAKLFGFEIGSGSSQDKWPSITRKPPLVYRIEQILCGRWFVRNIYQKLFYLKKKKCIKCDICYKNCPTGNISVGKSGYPQWGDKCILCFTCELRCPKEAVKCLAWPMFAPFMRYNVNGILKDDSLEKSKVRHHKGRVEPL